MAFRPIVISVTTDPSLPQFERHGEPVSIGVACPRGAVLRAERWGLTDQRGRAVPVQTTTLDRWGDGSVHWLLAEFQADVVAHAASFYALAPDETAVQDGPAVAIEQAGDVLRVDTGVATINVPRSGAGFITSASVGDASLLRSTAITAEDHRGHRYTFTTRRAVAERAGALSAVVRLDGALVSASGQGWLDAVMRLSFFAGLGTVTAALEVTNPRAAKHPGGAWDLGDPGSAFIRDLSIELATDVNSLADVWGSLDHSDHMEPAGRRFAVYQDSSGGSNWQHANHVNRDGHVAATFRGFRAMRAERLIEGLRATPIASIGGGRSRISVALPRFWQMFPKSIEADSRRCVVGMFPRVYGDVHELQGGERSTLALAMCFGRDTVSAEPLAWTRSPLAVSADPLSYRQAGAWAPLSAGSRRSAEGYEALVNTAIKGDETFEQRREVIDEYGWRNFGELYADHEAVNPPEGGSVSHYNNQYDAVAGFMTRFMQTARSPVVDARSRARDPCRGHRPLPHRSRSRGVQRRLLLAHAALPARRHRDASRVFTAQRRVRGRAGRGAQLHYRPDAASLPHRLGGVARRGDPAGQLGHRYGRWTQVAVPVDRPPRHRARERHPRHPRCGFSWAWPRRRQFDQRVDRCASPHRRAPLISTRPRR